MNRIRNGGRRVRNGGRRVARAAVGAALVVVAAACSERDPTAPTQQDLEVGAAVREVAVAATLDAGTRLVQPLGGEGAGLAEALAELAAALSAADGPAARAAQHAATVELAAVRALSPDAAADLEAVALALGLSAAALGN